MKATLAAYRSLVELARVDGEIAEAERRLLERYRKALGVELETAKLIELEPRATGSVRDRFSDDDGLDVLEMMIRVAYADDALDARERERLECVAERLGASPVRFAELLVDVQSEMARERRQRAHRARIVYGGLVAVLLLAALGGYLWIRGRGEHEQIGQLTHRVDEMALERAQRDEELVRRSLESSVGIDAFKATEERFGGSVLLIVVAYDLARDGERVSFFSSGSGFFISPDGLIVTNKHVAQPWKYSEEVGAAIAAGFRVDESSLQIGAWPAGATMIDERGEFDTGAGFYNRAGTLSVLRVTDDVMESRPVRMADGSVRIAEVHRMGDGDLALLQTGSERPVRAFPLPARLPGIEKLDPVMVLGFPRGVAILEGRRAELSVALGEVSKIENRIMITAPVVPGNSGGPVVDRAGHVIGVATLTPGGGLGICIATRDVLDLLPPAAEWIERAVRDLDDGRLDSARSALDLAAHRQPTPAERERIEQLKRRLGK